MAGSEDELTTGGFSSTAGWRLGTLFVIFLVLSTVFHSFLTRVERYLKAMQEFALRHIFNQLREELLTLGFLSLLLIAAEDELVKMCAPNSLDDTEKISSTCPAGQSPFWSRTTLHQAHIFLFLLALVQMVYAGLSMWICKRKIDTWAKWEAQFVEARTPRISMSVPIAKRRTRRFLWIHAFFWQFVESVNERMYLAIRNLFIFKLEVDENFAFLKYVVTGMEEDFARILELQWLLLLLAALAVAVNVQYFLIPVSAFCLGIVLTIGTILELAAFHMSNASVQLFQIPDEGVHEVGAEVDDSLEPEAVTVAVEEGANETPESSVSGGGLCPAIPSCPPRSTFRMQPTLAQTGRVNSQRKIFASNTDAKKFFPWWIGKPRRLLYLFSLTLFESSLSITIVIFGLWQDNAYVQSVGYGWVVVVGALAVDFMILVHSALFLLPTYALVSAAGSHSPITLQKYLRKRRKQSDQSPGHAGSGGSEMAVLTDEAFEEENQRSITALLGAVHERQMRLSGIAIQMSEEMKKARETQDMEAIRAHNEEEAKKASETASELMRVIERDRTELQRLQRRSLTRRQSPDAATAATSSSRHSLDAAASEGWRDEEEMATTGTPDGTVSRSRRPSLLEHMNAHGWASQRNSEGAVDPAWNGTNAPDALEPPRDSPRNSPATATATAPLPPRAPSPRE